MSSSQFASAGADHDVDVHAWARRQEAALREHRYPDLDLRFLAEEIAALGASEYRVLESALLRLLQHLLKWDYQPARRSRSWTLTITGQRENVEDVLRDNPSLAGKRLDTVHRAYRKGRTAMLRETGLRPNSIPETNPYSWDDMMTRAVDWPEP